MAGVRKLGVGVWLVAALMLALASVGCSGDDDSGNSDDPEPTSTAPTAPASPTETTTAEASDTPTGGGAGVVPPAPFAVTSPAWEPGGEIPETFTCKGDDLSPPLEFTRFDPGTQSLAVLMDDPDAPGGSFTHWLAWNIEPGMIPEGALPAGAAEGANDFGETGYGGPCPPEQHQYVITVYELDTMLELEEGAGVEAFRAAIEGHVLGEASYIGIFG